MESLRVRTKTFTPSAVVARATMAAIGAIAAIAATAVSGSSSSLRAVPPTTTESALQLTQEWDKTFPKSNKVDHQKVTFKNRYGITLAADLYLPKNRGNQRLAALVVGGPFGAVKEQSSGLYAQTMAERGFVALAFDPSYTGESGGEPRNVASPGHQHRGFQRRRGLHRPARFGRS